MWNGIIWMTLLNYIEVVEKAKKSIEKGESNAGIILVIVVMLAYPIVMAR